MKNLCNAYDPHFKFKYILNTTGALMVVLTAGQITVLYECTRSKTSFFLLWQLCSSSCITTSLVGFKRKTGGNQKQELTHFVDIKVKKDQLYFCTFKSGWLTPWVVRSLIIFAVLIIVSRSCLWLICYACYTFTEVCYSLCLKKQHCLLFPTKCTEHWFVSG